MSPPTLLLIRHGQTRWNVERRVLGRTDLPLDDEGLAQAAALVGALGPVDAVWSSPLSRARQTAEGLLQGKTCQIDEDLVEMDQGELDGCGEAELKARFGPVLDAWKADPEKARLPGGETMGEVQARGLRALHRIATASPAGARVAVVSHQLVIAATLCAISGDPLTTWRRRTHRNTAWTELSWTSPISIVAEGVAPHLPPTG